MLMALAFDGIGELPARCHPVVWYGRAIGRLVRAAPRGERAQLAYGAAMIALTAPLAILPAMAVRRLTRKAAAALAGRGDQWQGIAAGLVEGAALTPFFALRMLTESGRVVRVALERDDLPGARDALASLVSRERADLSPSLVAAAAVESLAENLSDSVIAPLLYYALFGLPGATFYRLVNTFDAMIGYRGRYEHLGKTAARLDDALNLLPARLTAALIVALAPLYGGDPRAAWRVWRRDARRTASPNAGHPMAATAGALGVQLEKVGYYTLGDALQPVSPATIQRAETMVSCVGDVAALLLAGAATWRETRAVWPQPHDAPYIRTLRAVKLGLSRLEDKACRLGDRLVPRFAWRIVRTAHQLPSLRIASQSRKGPSPMPSNPVQVPMSSRPFLPRTGMITKILLGYLPWNEKRTPPSE